MRSEAERAFYNAMEFHEAAIRCGEFGGDGSHNVLQPMAVCQSLAVELYLKALSIHRGKEPHGHNLLGLYENELDEKDREALTERYMELRNAPRSRMLREMAEVSKAFVEWRYSHEKDKLGLFVDHSVLGTLARSAHLVAREVAPEWEVLPYFQERLSAKPKLEFISAIAVDGQSIIDARTQRSIFGMMVAARKYPQSDITKGKDDRFSVTPTLYLNSEAAALNVEIRRGAYPQNPRTGQPVKYGTIFPLPIVTGQPRLDCKRHQD